MREEEIIQVIPGHFGWFAYGRDEQGAEFLTPVAMWALVESSGNVRRVVGLTAHGLAAKGEMVFPREPSWMAGTPLCSIP